MLGLGDLYKELKRRNVIKVTVGYLITAWLVLQIVSVLVPMLNAPEWVDSTTIIFLAVCFPLALVLAWAYELTPDGVKRTQHVELDQSVTQITGRKIDLSIITLLVLGLLFVSYEAYIREPVTEELVSIAVNTNVANAQTPNIAAVTSIAVLPFDNMSSDPEQEYFSDGLTEELLNVLAKVDKLRVAARSSSFFFKGKNLDIREIAQKLDVEHVLEGSVRKSGNKVRVTAQLIRAKSGYHLWSQTYDYELDDIFKIQDEISAAVVKQLRITLLDEQLERVLDHGTLNVKARDAYLLGRFYMRDRNPQSLAQAQQAFEQALSMDPAYQAAISGLADTLSLQVDYSGLSRVDYQHRTQQLLDPFYAKESNSAELLTSMGQFERNKGDLRQALALYKEAMKKKPNYAQAWHWASSVANLLGRRELAEQYLNQALTLDPYAAVLLSNKSSSELNKGNHLAAENFARRGVEVAPEMAANYQRLLQINWTIKNRADLAWQLVAQTDIEFSFAWATAKVKFHLALDQWQLAEQEVALMEAHAPDNYNTYFSRLRLEFYKVKILGQDDGKIRALINGSALAKDKPEFGLVRAYAAMLTGQYQLCTRLIEQHYPELAGQHIKLAFDDRIDAAMTLVTCDGLLPKQRFNALATKINDFTQVVINAGFHQLTMGLAPVQLYLLEAGNEPQALDYLQALLEQHHWLEDVWSLEFDPMYSKIHANPEFIRLLKLAKTRVAQQKRQIKQARLVNL